MQFPPVSNLAPGKAGLLPLLFGGDSRDEDDLRRV